MSRLQQHDVGSHRTAAGSLVRDHAHELRLIKRQIQSEFDYLPGLKLTFAQARRLFGLDQDRCARVLALLVEEGTLTLTTDGAYISANRNRITTKTA